MQIIKYLTNSDLITLFICLFLSYHGINMLLDINKAIEKQVNAKKIGAEKYGFSVNENSIRKTSKIFLPIMGFIFSLLGFTGFIISLYRIFHK